MDLELIKRIEAVLFASAKFMSAEQIAELLDEKKKAVQTALADLKALYEERGGAIHVVQEEDEFKLHVRDEYLELVSKIVHETEVSGTVLETLAIIAWRSPILQSEVVDIRGSNAYEHIKELVENGFVTKSPDGRSYRLAITQKFFDYFDIEGRDDIRNVFKQVEEEHRKKEMELELAAKRKEAEIEEHLAAQEAEVTEEQTTLPRRQINLEDMDSVLEKAAKKREEIGADFAALRKKDDDEEKAREEAAEKLIQAAREQALSEMSEEDDASSLEEAVEDAAEVRKKVEEDADLL